MRAIAPALALAIAACGSTPPPKMTCDAGLCGGVCCGPGTECMTDAAGDQTCATLCALPSDCTTTAEPCCMPVLVNGDYGGMAICAANPVPSTAYSCTCGTTTDCASSSGECAPLIGAGSGAITGPYVCVPNSGDENDGCAGNDNSICSATGQYCAQDMGHNLFCSKPCSMDSDCGNPSVACCNATCHVNEMCCGLCGH